MIGYLAEGSHSDVLWPVVILIASLSIALAICYAAWIVSRPRGHEAPYVELAPPALNGKGKIRLTFVGENMRSEPKEFDTDDLGEALAAYGRRHFGGGPPNSGPAKWIVAFIVENGDARMEEGESARRFRDIAGLEEFRARPR